MKPQLPSRRTLVSLALLTAAACSAEPTPSEVGAAGRPAVITLRPYDTAPIACGSTECVQASQPGFSVPRVCCHDAARSLCGTRASNDDCVGSVTSAGANNCPKPEVFGMVLEACCTPQGQCGADSTAVGLGCVDLADMNFRNLAKNPPDPRPCGAPER